VSANSKSSRETKTFYPEEYYKRVGYAKHGERKSVAESRTDALGQRVRERFNEDLGYADNKSAHGVTLNTRNVNKVSMAHTMKEHGKEGSVFSQQRSELVSSRQSFSRRKVAGVHKKSSTLAPRETDSVITTDKLKKFNEVHDDAYGADEVNLTLED